ncbi:MAG: EamA family transporter [Owenweeksia sp.]|nr:EamA family transporter [Owenweeksia sp.]MBF98628.1 EamA family transporter [Owenweeksia sp.]HBF20971.1 EamA family transporter [Cryomorphaceae bacterium]HCQ15463.1 EamA family transporter [Cryomorphaceae bacterium]|tara:strand:+ start:1669 stop:2541 length:873 start_codon:yes stop_codon:yes gene_type:complete
MAHLALLAVAIIYGLNYSIAKDVMPGHITPLTFILVRAIGATSLFWLTARLFSWERIKRKDLPRLALCGMFGVACNQMLFFEGLNLTTPINAAVMMTVNPILVLVLSAIILKESLRPGRIFGIVLGIMGALFLITRGGQVTDILDSDKSWGNVLVLLNALSYGVYLVLVKPLMKKYKAITVIRWVFLFGLFMVLPFGGPHFGDIEWGAMPVDIWWKVGFVVICTTYLAYLLNVFALKTVSSTTVSFYIYLQPLFAALTAIVMGKDEITLILCLAALLLFTGVYFVSFYKR